MGITKYNSFVPVRNFPRKRLYALGVIMVLVSLGSIFGFTSPAYAFTSFTFDKPFYFLNHGAQITATLDPNDDCIKNNCQTINVFLQDNSHPQATFTFNRMPNTNSYQSPGYINFTTIASNPPNSLQVNDLDCVPNGCHDQNDKVTITYNGASAWEYVWSNDYNPNNIIMTFPASGSLTYIFPPSTQVLSQPDFSAKLTCQHSTSGDAICDEWKNPNHNGLTITVNNIQYHFSCPLTDQNCGYVGTKEIFVELDSMLDQDLSAQAITDVKNAFLAQGILLHVYQDDEINFHQRVTSGPVASPTSSDFNQIKQWFFGTQAERTGQTSDCNTLQGQAQINCVHDLLTAKRQVFHYALTSNRQSISQGSSGISDIKGNDIHITLGPFTGGVGSLDQQEGTFMHELGHNLGLRHGGNNDLNCKPNYPSVMSYSRQFSDLNPHRILTYSSGSAAALIQGSINEQAGIGGTGWTVFRPSTGTPPYNMTQTGVATDYEPEGNTNGLNLTNMPLYNILSKGCNQGNTNLNMYDYNDWNNLLFDMKTTGNFGNGAGGPDPNLGSMTLYDDPSKTSTPTTSVAQTQPISNVALQAANRAGLWFDRAQTGLATMEARQENSINDPNAVKALQAALLLMNHDIHNGKGNVTQILMDLSSSSKYNNDKDEAVSNSTAITDDAFATAKAHLQNAFYSTALISFPDQVKILGLTLDNHRDRIDDKIMALRTHPIFVNNLYTHPDHYAIESDGITIGMVKEMRILHIDQINATINRLNLTTTQLQPLFGNLADAKKAVYSDSLPTAIQDIEYVKVQASNLTNDIAKQSKINSIVNSVYLSLQAANAPSQGLSALEPKYIAIAFPLITLLDLGFLIGVLGLIGLVIVLIIYARKWKKQVDEKKTML